MWTLIITILTTAGPTVHHVPGFEIEGLCANAGAGYVREMRMMAPDARVMALCVPMAKR